MFITPDDAEVSVPGRRMCNSVKEGRQGDEFVAREGRKSGSLAATRTFDSALSVECRVKPDCGTNRDARRYELGEAA